LPVSDRSTSMTYREACSVLSPMIRLARMLVNRLVSVLKMSRVALSGSVLSQPHLAVAPIRVFNSAADPSIHSAAHCMPTQSLSRSTRTLLCSHAIFWAQAWTSQKTGSKQRHVVAATDYKALYLAQLSFAQCQPPCHAQYLYPDIPSYAGE